MGVEDLQTAHQQHRQAEKINPMRHTHDRRMAKHPASKPAGLRFRLKSAHFVQPSAATLK